MNCPYLVISCCYCLKVSLFERGKPPKHVSLREMDDDFQTMCIRTAASTFDFKVHCGSAEVEGQLRYHPFLYDKETYPTVETDEGLFL